MSSKVILELRFKRNNVRQPCRGCGRIVRKGYGRHLRVRDEETGLEGWEVEHIDPFRCEAAAQTEGMGG